MTKDILITQLLSGALVSDCDIEVLVDTDSLTSPATVYTFIKPDGEIERTFATLFMCKGIQVIWLKSN